MNSNPVETVKIYVTYDARGCHVGIACPDPVYVKTPNTLLQFEMQPGDFVFHEKDAIKVTDGKGNFIGSFTVGPNNAVLVDLRKVFGRYEYEVGYKYKEVPHHHGHHQDQRRLKLFFTFDPIIINGTD